MDNTFIVVIPFYNAEKWIGKCLKSLLLQSYLNYKCIMIDDRSTDNSLEIAKKLTAHDDRFMLIHNEKNIGPLGNVYGTVMERGTNIDDEDIVVILDGDDFFSSKESLKILNDFYNKNECWMTYGSYINLSDRQRGKFSKPLPSSVIEGNLYREYAWCTSHLRTYKVFLVKEINIKDLVDDKGEFLKAAGDLALTFPLLEMSGHKAKFIKDILYIWNDLNTLNEHKAKRQEQLMCEKIIRSRKKYTKLEERK